MLAPDCFPGAKRGYIARWGWHGLDESRHGEKRVCNVMDVRPHVGRYSRLSKIIDLVVREAS